jgi:hypothetical protein
MIDATRDTRDAPGPNKVIARHAIIPVAHPVADAAAFDRRRSNAERLCRGSRPEFTT